MVGDVNTYDTVLELCRDQNRRIVLAMLSAERGPLTLNDLAESIVEHNHRMPITNVPPVDLTEIQISLLHKHLPKLEEWGVVEFDSSHQLVEPTPTFDEWQPLFSAILDADPQLEAPVEQ